VININVPNLPMDEIQGVRLTRLGHRGRAQQPMKVTDPRGNPGFWIGGIGEPEDGGPGTDFDAIRQHCVSVTPLQVDMTRYESFDLLSDWLTQLW
jgi:5'-nucleotidase